MATKQNIAAWLPGVGKQVEVGQADIAEPSTGQLLIEVKAVAVQPAEYKIQAGILPFPLTYPTIIGLSFTGIVAKVGPGVTRFKEGDRVVTNSAGSLRNDPKFGGYQHYALTTQELTAEIGDLAFESTASVSNLYAAMSAIVLHLHLDRPVKKPNPENKMKKVLIWGASSSFGAFAVQLAAQAGYTVVGVSSAANAQLVASLGASKSIDRRSATLTEELVSLGPYEAVLAAADAAEDQHVIGAVLAAHGGGTFLSTMGIRAGVTLPPGVSGFFAQFLDDYLDPQHEEFTQWVWWDYLPDALATGSLKLLPVRVLGGLARLQDAWDMLKRGDVSGQRLVLLADRI